LYLLLDIENRTKQIVPVSRTTLRDYEEKREMENRRCKSTWRGPALRIRSRYGNISGYRWGVERKKALLEMEQRG
jgi:hypothetical protein